MSFIWCLISIYLGSIYRFCGYSFLINDTLSSIMLYIWWVFYMPPRSCIITIDHFHLVTRSLRLYCFAELTYFKLFLFSNKFGHCNDLTMSAMASQITSLTIVYSAVYSGVDQRKRQSSASLASVRGIHRWPGNSLHKGQVTRKMFPFDDVIMQRLSCNHFTRCLTDYATYIHIFEYYCQAGMILIITIMCQCAWKQTGEDWEDKPANNRHKQDVDLLGPLLLTWFNFNPSMDK